MASFRTLSPSLWSDPFIEGLSAQEKLLYIYLFSNEHVNNVGYMQATLRKISFETAVPQDDVAAFLEKTDRLGKTARDGDSILCLNFVRHQTTKSPKVTQNLCKVFNLVGSAKLRRALLGRYPDIFKSADTIPDPVPDGSDTVSIPYQDSIDTVGKQLQDRTVQDKAKKDPEHTHDGSRGSCSPLDLSGACVPPASLCGEDIAERQDGVRQERRKGDYEFSLLRDAYDKARQEGPMAGRQEFLSLYHSQEWPGIDELLASVEKLCAEDDQFRRGFAPGLAKFIQQRMWLMEPRAPAVDAGQGETQEEAERRHRFLERQKAYMAELAAKKKGRR